MDFPSLEGFEEFFVDGVINPAVASSDYRANTKLYRQLTERVFALHEPSKPEFDLVFLHGIGSDEFHCWSTPKGLLWPADFIPQDFPTARVLTVGYEHSLWNWKTLEKKDAPKQNPPSVAPTPAQEGSFSRAWESFSDTVESSLASWWSKSGENDAASAKELTSGAGRAPAANPAATVDNTGGGSDSTSLLEILMSASSAPTETALLSPVGAAAQGSESLQRVAADVASRLLSPSVGVGQRPVVFVVHSMGGLVTKKMLVSLYQMIANAPPPLPDRLPEPIDSIVNGCGADLRKSATPEAYSDCLNHASMLLSTVRGVVFYCTPHFGSGLASVITGLQRYYQSIGGLTPTHVVTGLGDHNKDELKALNTQFVELIERLQESRGGDDLLTKYRGTGRESLSEQVTANPPGLALLSFGETRKLNNLVRVVEPESANPVPDDPRFPFHLIDGDHGSVNRPDTKTSPAYSLLYGFLDRLQQRGRLRLDFVETPALNAVPDAAANTAGQPTTDISPREGTSPAEAANAASLDELWDQCFRDPDAVTPDTPRTTAGPAPSSSELSDGKRHHNEAALSARVLQSERERLHGALTRFFGRASPPELDGVLRLSADMLTLFRRLQDALMHAPPLSTPSGMVDRTSVRYAVLESFNTPLLLAVHWTRWVSLMIERFALQQRERHIIVLESMPEWEAVQTDSTVVPHLYTSEVEEIHTIQVQISTLQSEWEGFRRYAILHVRTLIAGGTVSGTSRTAPDSTANKSDAFELLSNQSLTTLFFSKTVRSAISHSLHDGGFFSSLLSHYMGSAVGLGVSPLSLTTPAVVKGVPHLSALERLVQERDYALSLIFGNMASTSSSLLKPSTADDIRSTAATRRLSTLALTPEQLTTVAAPLLAIAPFLTGCVASTFRRDLWGNSRGDAASAYLSQSLTSLAACQRALEKQYRFAREGAVRQRGAAEKDSRESWWPNKMGGRSKSQLQEDIDALDGAFATYATLSAAVELGVHVLLVLEYMNEAEEAAATRQPSSTLSSSSSPRLTAALGVLTNAVCAAQLSYEHLERVTRRDAAAAEMSKPFTKPTDKAHAQEQHRATATTAGGTYSQAGVAAGGDTMKNMDILETAKETFREAMSKLLKDMEKRGKGGGVNPAVATATHGRMTEREEKNPSSAATVASGESVPASTADTEGSPRSVLPWSPKAASGSTVVTLLINSVISAWETVRRGVDKPPTAVFFAHSVMVAWWAAEEQVAAVGARHGDSALLAQLQRRRKAPKTPSVVLDSLKAAAVGGGPGGEKVTSSPPTVLVGHKDATLALLQNVDHSVSSAWLAQRGVTVEQTTLQASFAEQQRRLQPCLSPADGGGAVDTSSTPDPLRTASSSVLSLPPISPFVIRAVQLDKCNSLAQCLQGNRFFLRLRTSPDAAHAYSTVLRHERVPSSALYRHAAVGLAWIHLHRVTCAAMEIAVTDGTPDLHRLPHTPLSDRCAVTAAMGGSTLRNHGSVQLGAVDPLSAHAAPVNFLSFYKRGWQTAAIGERLAPPSGLHTREQLIEGDQVATPAWTAAQDARAHGLFGRSRSEVAAAHRAMQSALEEHLCLSQHYFNEVLQSDPTNPGALCGAGRLCSLVLPDTQVSRHRLPLPSQPHFNPGAPLLDAQRTDPPLRPTSAHSATLRESIQYFRAALSGVAMPSPDEATTDSGEPFADMTNVFRSYAANWLGDHVRPGAEDYAFFSPAFDGTTRADGQTESRAATRRQRFDASCTEAADWYRRAIRINGFNDWALCNLGVLQVQSHVNSNSGSDTDTIQGIDLLEKALQLNPTNQWALWTLSQSSPHLARRQECRTMLRRLLTTSFRSTFL